VTTVQKNKFIVISRCSVPNYSPNVALLFSYNLTAILERILFINFTYIKALFSSITLLFSENSVCQFYLCPTNIETHTMANNLWH